MDDDWMDSMFKDMWKRDTKQTNSLHTAAQKWDLDQSKGERLSWAKACFCTALWRPRLHDCVGGGSLVWGAAFTAYKQTQWLFISVFWECRAFFASKMCFRILMQWFRTRTRKTSLENKYRTTTFYLVNVLEQFLLAYFQVDVIKYILTVVMAN